MNTCTRDIVCSIGVRQGECLPPFLFSMFLNDLEEEPVTKSVNDINIGRLKLFILLYAEDIAPFNEIPEDLQP